MRMPRVVQEATRPLVTQVCHDGDRRGGCLMPKTTSPPKRLTVLPPPSEITSSDLHELVRKLVALARTRGELPRDASGRAVLFDAEVDGVQCVLVEVIAPEEGRPGLSPREQEIVRMVAKGYGNKTIARVLDISCWTVGTYLRRIFAKLGVSTRAAMIVKAHHLYFSCATARRD